MAAANVLFGLTRKSVYRVMGARLVVYSAMPKSGSQFLTTLMENAFGGRHFFQAKVSSGYGHNFLDARKIPWVPDIDGSFRLYGHIPFIEHNEKVLRTVDPRFIAIVSLRSLPDIVVSYFDHIEAKQSGPLDMRVPESIESFRYYFNLQDIEKFQYIIDYILPWFVKFTISWLNFEYTDRLLFLKYDDIASNPRKIIDDIYIFSKKNGINLDIRTNVDFDRKKNFNKGVIGRGRKILTDNQLRQIKTMARVIEKYENSEWIYDYVSGNRFL